jgi:hypothetical protein
MRFDVAALPLKPSYGARAPLGLRGLRCDGELQAAFAVRGHVQRLVVQNDGRLRIKEYASPGVVEHLVLDGRLRSQAECQRPGGRVVSNA